MPMIQTKDGTKKEEIMKLINKALIMTAAIMLAASCEQMSENSDIRPVELTPMTLTAGVDSDLQVETKTTYSGRKVFWEAGDAISVFFSGDQITKQEFTATALYNDNTIATFEGLGDENAASYVAVYPHSDVNAYDGTNFTVNIPSVQVGVAQGFASGANTSVAYSTDGTISFRNVGALIAFRFETPEAASITASVTIKAKTAVDGKYYGLTGTSTVALQDGIPVAAEGSADHVTIMAPEGGFECGTNKVYYAVVYPGEVNGFEMTYTTNTPTPMTSVIKNDTPATLKRNYLLSFGMLSDPYELLPETIEMNIDFATWPFNESCIYNSTVEGTYTYTLDYIFNGINLSKDFKFVMYGGKGGSYAYSAEGSFFSPGIANSRITVPAIPERYLKSVKVSIKNAYTKKLTIVKTDFTTILAENVNMVAGTPAEIVFPYEGVNTEIATAYILRFPSTSTQLTNITLVYTKSKPE